LKGTEVNLEGDKDGRTEVDDFRNSDEYLRREAPRVQEDRRRAGLGGLVGGLQAVIVNAEASRQWAAVAELLEWTGLEFVGAFRDTPYTTCVLKTAGSADLLVRSRKGGDNPFRRFNEAPKSNHLPNTRLETFVFEAKDLEKYVAIQKSRGVRFLTDAIIHTPNFSFIQTAPSRLTGNSLGFIQWEGERGDYSAPATWET